MFDDQWGLLVLMFGLPVLIVVVSVLWILLSRAVRQQSERELLVRPAAASVHADVIKALEAGEPAVAAEHLQRQTGMDADAVEAYVMRLTEPTAEDAADRPGWPELPRRNQTSDQTVRAIRLNPRDGTRG